MAIEVTPTLSEIRQFQVTGKQPKSLKDRVKKAQARQKEIDKQLKKFEGLNTDDFLKKLEKEKDKEVLRQLMEIEFSGERRESVIAGLNRKYTSAEEPEEEPETEDEPETDDLSAMTVNQIEEKVSEMDDIDILKRWVEIEKAGKERSSAVDAIQERIKEIAKDLFPEEVEGGFWRLSNGKKFPPEEKEKAAEEQAKLDLM